jgi:hypothetical protein
MSIVCAAPRGIRYAPTYWGELTVSVNDFSFPGMSDPAAITDFHGIPGVNGVSNSGNTFRLTPPGSVEEYVKN